MEEPTLCSCELCTMKCEAGSEFCKNCDAECLGDEDSAFCEDEVSEAVESEEDEKAETKKSNLKFHSIHGKNIKLEDDGRRAVRSDHYDDGIVFSDRPVSIDELVGIRQTTLCTKWSSRLRFGVTSVDPASIESYELPSYSVLAFRKKPGYWVDILPEEHRKQGDLVQFSVTSNGDIIYDVSGESKGIFLSGVDTSRPLWVTADLFGKTESIEFEADPSLEREQVQSEEPSIPNDPEPRMVSESEESLNEEGEETSNDEYLNADLLNARKELKRVLDGSKNGPVMEERKLCSCDAGSEFCKNCDASCLGGEDSTVAEDEATTVQSSSIPVDPEERMNEDNSMEEDDKCSCGCCISKRAVDSEFCRHCSSKCQGNDAEE